MPPDMALWLALISPVYPRLEDFHGSKGVRASEVQLFIL